MAHTGHADLPAAGPPPAGGQSGPPPAGGQSGPPPAGGQSGLLRVMGYLLALDRLYQPETHMWVLPAGPGLVRVGMDPLGAETSGTLAQLSIRPAGTELAAGGPFGQLEAAKFVGPLVSPVPGTLAAVNEAVIADPGLAEHDPFGAGWLIEVSIAGTADALPGLLADPGEITAWFAGQVEEYRLKGVLAQ